MPRKQEKPCCTRKQCPHTYSETQDLDIAQVLESMKETCLPSSHPVMLGNPQAASAAGVVNTPQGPQSEHTLCSIISAISLSKSDESSSSQEEEDSSSSSQSPSDTENVPRDPLDEKAALLVNFLLLKYQMKEPITKADMLNAVIGEYEDHFPEIILKASERMEMIFGLDLKEVDPISHKYALLIKLGLTYDGMLSGEDGMPKTGILILILGVIFMKGNRATEEEVWEVLNVTGIYSGQKHFIFGNPTKLITKELVQEKYLKYQQVPNSDPAQYEFLWGPRAYAETTKMKVLEFVAKVHGTDPSSFPSQYEEALKDEEEKAQAEAAASPGATAMASTYSNP
ncbi:melanoma-associated antigen B16-like [Loxodonta africana]|uniref:melanoma-associated antigen B16-like n=1 Tax=Loxodonta africana TaxID=9785 RepID=UPI00054051BF|nr:melanoma-associated antigen B16-like [Loxodonta africana]